jgi:2'-5' RNA ligase
MGIENKGVLRVRVEDGLNVYALVIYIPDPLGAFLDELRRELVPHDNPHAHVSVLPPRPLAVDWRQASEQARTLLESWQPFDIELSEIEKFPVTDVIYIGVGGGESQMRDMHRKMNQDALEFQEPFAYHPHVTLAQEIPQHRVEELHERATQRWRDYRGSRRFRVEHAVFVQNTLSNQWVDLAEYSLGAVAAKL